MAGATNSDRGRIDDTTAFVTDIAPTILELADVELPSVMAGVHQLPLHGRSLARTLAGSRLEERPAQYLEVAGHRAILSEGWKAVTFHTPGTDFDADRWELYHVDVDPTETRDLSIDHPDRLAKLVARWWEAADENQVLPLASRGKEQLVRDHPGRTTWVLYPEMTPVPQAAAPEISGHHFTIMVEVESIAPSVEGVLMSMGDHFGGVSLYVVDDRLTFAVNALGTLTTTSLPSRAHHGATELVAALRLESEGSASFAVSSNAAPEIATGSVSWVPRLRFFMGTAQCGRDNPHPVSSDYEGAFPYTGRIARAVVDVEPEERTGEATDAIVRYLMGD